MDEETHKKLREIEEKLDNIQKSVEQTKKYFKWTAIISIVVIVLPLIGILFILPSFVSLYSGIDSGQDVNQVLDSLGL